MLRRDRLEMLIKDYWTAIDGKDVAKIGRLSREVDAEAERSGYPNYTRLRRLHAAAERAGAEALATTLTR
jgi:hypothetical protein